MVTSENPVTGERQEDIIRGQVESSWNSLCKESINNSKCKIVIQHVHFYQTYIKGIGLQTLSFISKERDQQNKHFDTTLSKSVKWFSKYESFKIQQWPPMVAAICLASHVTKKEKCLFTVVDLLFTFVNYIPLKEFQPNLTSHRLRLCSF